MAWPSDADYQDAVQSPSLAFADSSLKAASVELGPLNLPKARGGNFAIVFKVREGTQDWAIKCFKHELADRRDRYAAIDAHLVKSNLPCMSRFMFLQKGILVRGTWFPILKMEWVRGELLRSWIERNLSNPSELQKLASQWIRVIRSLQTARIGHGDLQHGNIVVWNGEIRLLDYDSMFVPSLSGRECPELGHENFQHPQRKGRHFGSYIDLFAAWVIHESLIALSIQPSLWSKYADMRESLLFCRADFLAPQTSPVLTELANSKNPRLKASASLIRAFLLKAPDAIPELNEQGSNNDTEVVLCHRCGQRLRVPQTPSALILTCPRCRSMQPYDPSPTYSDYEVIGDWWKEQKPNVSTNEESFTQFTIAKLPDIDPTLFWPITAADVDWLHQISPTEPSNVGKRNRSDWEVDTSVCLCSGLVIPILILMGVMSSQFALAMIWYSASIATLALAVGYLRIRYKRHPVLRAFVDLNLILSSVTAKQRELELLRIKVSTNNISIRKDFSDEIEAIQKRHKFAQADLRTSSARHDESRTQAIGQKKESLAELKREWQKELRDLESITNRERELKQKVSEFSTERSSQVQAMERVRDAELVALRAQLLPKIQTVEYQLRTLSSSESDELRKQLHNVQTMHLETNLRRYALRDASIEGIGPQRKEALYGRNLYTAADICVSALKGLAGFGKARKKVILDWAKSIDTECRRSMPTGLPLTELQRIRGGFSVRRSALETDIQELRKQLTERERLITDKLSNELSNLAISQRHREQTIERELELIQQEKASREASINKRNQSLADILVKEILALESAEGIVSERLKSQLAVCRKEFEKEIDLAAICYGDQIDHLSSQLRDIRESERKLLWKKSRVDSDLKRLRIPTFFAFLFYGQ